ncbi:MAG: hypothetical protein V3V99_07675 [candidate division Zixibacteria bacterium]
MKVPVDYWPEPLKNIPKEAPLADEYVTVAEVISSRDPDYRYRQTFTGLVKEKYLIKLLNDTEEHIFHCDIETSGPHPCGPNDYRPSFKIVWGNIVPNGIEPLVLSWEGGSQKILAPDSGLLMTYGLIPRLVKINGEEFVVWDDLSYPQYDIVKCKMAEEFDWSRESHQYISIHKDYLLDYATLRDCHLIQIYVENNVSPLTDFDARLLNEEYSMSFSFPGRRINMTTEGQPSSTLGAVVWGIRHLISPGNLPVTEGYRDYGELVWPGLKNPVTEKYSGPGPMPYIYVKDSVLDFYESNPHKYDIYPESGSVGFRNQWSVGYSNRVGRDLIRVEIKKLYESTPPDVVRHWHKYAVEPPKESPEKLRKILNVADRSKRVYLSYIDLGKTISIIANNAGLNNSQSSDFIGFNHLEVNHLDWWSDKKVFPITCHIPIEMSEDRFLDRCLSLTKLIIDSLKEKNLRKLIIHLGVESDIIKKFRSLKLLAILIELAIIANDTGLNLIKNSEEIVKRWIEISDKLKDDEFIPSPINVLYVLYEVRIEKAHSSNNIDNLLKSLDVDKASLTTGWGLLMDRFYDEIADSLEEMNHLLCEAIE